MVVIGGDCRIFVGGQSSVKVGGVAVHVETRLGVVRDTPRRFHAILGDPIRQDTGWNGDRMPVFAPKWPPATRLMAARNRRRICNFLFDLVDSYRAHKIRILIMAAQVGRIDAPVIVISAPCHPSRILDHSERAGP